jgi:hypothetical protein
MQWIRSLVGQSEMIRLPLGIYYKTCDSDGTDFKHKSIHYEADSLIRIHNPTRKPEGYLTAAETLGESLASGGWVHSSRLFEVRGEPLEIAYENPRLKVFSELLVVRELPRWQVFGPNGNDLERLFAILKNTSSTDPNSFYITGKRWESLLVAARSLETDDNRLSHNREAWDHAYALADEHGRCEACNGATTIAGRMARTAAHLATFRDKWLNTTEGSAERRAAVDELHGIAGSIDVFGLLRKDEYVVAAELAFERTALAIVMRDVLPENELNELTYATRECCGEQLWGRIISSEPR